MTYLLLAVIIGSVVYMAIRAKKNPPTIDDINDVIVFS